MEKSLLNPDVGSSRAEAHFHHVCDPDKSETRVSGSEGQARWEEARAPRRPSPHPSRGLPRLLPGTRGFVLPSCLRLRHEQPAADSGGKKVPLLRRDPELYIICDRAGRPRLHCSTASDKAAGDAAGGRAPGNPSCPTFPLPLPPPSGAPAVYGPLPCTSITAAGNHPGTLWDSPSTGPRTLHQLRRGGDPASGSP